MATKELFALYKIPLFINFCKNDSLITRARNNLVAKAMNNPDMTHILFIDNDITWDPIDILKLLIADKDLIGGIYPYKNFDWKKLQEPNAIENILNKKNNTFFKNTDDDRMIQHSILNYNLNYKTKNIEVTNNLIEVRHIATGFMLIKRSVIEQLSNVYPDTKYVDDINYLNKDEERFAYALFDCAVIEKHYFSEDWLFCHRWSQINGKIYTDISINLQHTGLQDYDGSLLASLIK
tara:strand:- start:81 stop:788 length:708 start_codon:yes stop_codon:yes gene_type:complete